MDLVGIPKRAWRARLIEAYRTASNNERLPKGEYFFTLAGPSSDLEDSWVHGKPAKNSELDYLMNRNFISAKQYVGVERNFSVHFSNSMIKDATWICGDFAQELAKFSESHNVGFVSADLMCGIDVAIPTIKSVLGSVKQNTFVAFNILAHHQLYGVCFGRKIRPPYNTLMAKMPHLRKKVVDRFTYRNIAVGPGAGAVEMETIAFLT